MTTYIALLRGINVGGKNIIKMAELKQLFEEIGLENVKTYIQSGNVLFRAEEQEQSLIDKLEKGIEVRFGFKVPVVLRTAEEFKNIISSCPFTKEEIAEAEASNEGESLYTAMLKSPPTEEKVEAFKVYKSQNEEYVVLGKEVFLLFRSSIRNSKLASNLQKLDASATVRNWKTMNKLMELAKEIDK